MDNGEKKMTHADDPHNLSTCIELVDEWKIPFAAKEIDASEKTKRRKKSQTKSKTNGFSRGIIPLLFKQRNCVIGVQDTGNDIIVLDTDIDESRTFEGHAKAITSMVKINDQQTVVTAAKDGSICAWEVVGGEKGVELKKTASGQFQDEIIQMVAHPINNMVLVWVKPNLLKLRHIGHIEMDEVSIEVQDSHIKEVSLTSDQIIYATDKGNIYVWSYAQSDNPVFNFETPHSNPPMVSSTGNMMASWTTTEQCISLWSIKSRQKIADLQLRQPPAMVSLFEKSNCLIVVNGDHEMMLYRCKPPKEIRRVTLATFNSPVLALHHHHGACTVDVFLESGQLLHMAIDCDALEEDEDEEEPEKKRTSSFTCVIL